MYPVYIPYTVETVCTKNPNLFNQTPKGISVHQGAESYQPITFIN